MTEEHSPASPQEPDATDLWQPASPPPSQTPGAESSWPSWLPGSGQAYGAAPGSRPQGSYPEGSYPQSSYPQGSYPPFPQSPGAQSAPPYPQPGYPAPAPASAQQTPPSPGTDGRPRRGPMVVAIVAVLVAAVAVGFAIRMARGTADKDSAQPAAATSSASANASSSAAESPAVVNDGTGKPSVDAVRQIFGDDSLNISWISLSTTGQTAVAYSPSFSGLDGRSTGADGGHLVMVSRDGRWQKLSGGVITGQSECSALMQLGDKEAVNASAVMNDKFCDPEVIFRLVSGAEITTAGMGPLSITKEVSVLSPTRMLPNDLGGACTRSTPPYESYSGFIPDIWTQDGKVQAFAVEGGTNRSKSGAGIGTSLDRLHQIYGNKLSDVTPAYPGEPIDQALALTYDGSEIDFLVSGGGVTRIVVRSSAFSTDQC